MKRWREIHRRAQRNNHALTRHLVPPPLYLEKGKRKSRLAVDGAAGFRIFLINTHIIYIIWPEKFPKASAIRGTIDTSINIAAHPCASFNILEHLCVS